MSLATRCPACSTVFRVLQDQLRVSEGWVRCGQCQEVFNALETLFDLGTPVEAGSAASPPQATFAPPPPEQPNYARYAPPPAPPAVSPPPPVAATTASVVDEQPDFAPTAPATVPPDDPFSDIDTFTVLDDGDSLGGIVADQPLPEDDWHSLSPPLPPEDEEPADLRIPPAPTGTASAPSASERVDSFAAPAKPAPARPAPPAAKDSQDFFNDEVDTVSAAAFDVAPEEDEPEAPTPSRFIGPMPDWARTPTRERRSKKSKSKRPYGADAEGLHAQPHQSGHAHRKRRKPQFVRQAERAALWRRPVVRLVLGTGALALTTLLVAQFGYHYREPLAAQVPALAPALHAGCGWLQCKIGAPRAIERIRLDASDLTRTDQERVLRFTADLHNTADYPVRAPALDVSFTDALGRIVSRKVLLPAELGARSESIAADTQWRIDARLAVGELQVAGYTVEVFYP
jgi:predicted Zn finger-like uncharacterized protein